MNTTTLSDIKQQHRGMWAAGRYADVAEHVDDVPGEHLLRTVTIDSGHAVLDVATGTGNVALRAARLSSDVTGLDLVPSLLDVARSRADTAGVDVHWIEGDAEALPFGDASFDRVLSVFGVQSRRATKWWRASSCACAARAARSGSSTGRRPG